MSDTSAGFEYFDRFGIHAGLTSEVLSVALSRGGDFAELYFEHRSLRALGLEDGEVNRASTSVSLGVGVRVVKGDQTGYAYTEDLGREALRLAASTAAAVADGPARPGPTAYRIQPKGTLYVPERRASEVGVAQKKPLLDAANALAFARDPRVIKVRVGLVDSDGAVLVVDSDGRVSFDLQPMVRLNLGVTAQDGSRRESNGVGRAARQGFEFLSPERMKAAAEEAVDRTLFLFDASVAPAGAFPVVLGAGASGILLHEAIGHGMEADFNRKGISVYSDQLGQPIASPLVTIVDDGTLPTDRGAVNYDDEGTPGQRTVLVEGGILKTFLHDRISAAHYGVAPTGNGRRESFKHPPLPRMRSTYMLPGPHDPAEIIASVKRGVYAETFTNGQVMIGAGDFTFYIKTGYLIEDGKLTRPIKDTNLIGNGPEVLRQTDMVGSDFKLDEGTWTCGKDGQSVPVSLGMPTVRVAQITVGGVEASHG